MKKIFIITLFLLSCQSNNIEVYFSPNGGALEAISKELDLSNNNIKIQAFSFTNQKIGEALSSAIQREVKIEGVLDPENLRNKNSLLKPLADQGVQFYIDDKHKIAHNKIIIIDDKTVITGSFNFTKSAEESNAENVLIIKDKKISDQYILNWNKHKQHSTIYSK